MYIFRLIDYIFKPQAVYAHCDIPCGIYDPHEAQMAAHTVIRMTKMLDELPLASDKVEDRKKFVHQVSRLTKVKEEHAELVKHQIRIIWGDYFKAELLGKNKEVSDKTSLRSSSSQDSTEGLKDLHDLVFKIMKLASKARQEINLETAQELLESVQKFAEIFWKSKDRETVRVKSGYPTEGDIVLPK